MQGMAAQFASGKYGAFRGAAGIISAADIDKYGAECEPLFVACKAASPNYRGIRLSAAHDPNYETKFSQSPNVYMEPKFREGFALLEKYGLLFDAWAYSCRTCSLSPSPSACLSLSLPPTLSSCADLNRDLTPLLTIPIRSPCLQQNFLTS